MPVPRAAVWLVAAAIGVAAAGCQQTSDSTDAPGSSTSPGSSAAPVPTLAGLPEGWPAAVPLPDGGTVQRVTEVDQGSGTGYLAVVTYPDSPEALIDAVSGTLAGAGLVSETTVSDGDQALIAFHGNGWRVAVTVGENPAGGSRVAVTVAPWTDY